MRRVTLPRVHRQVTSIRLAQTGVAREGQDGSAAPELAL